MFAVHVCSCSYHQSFLSLRDSFLNGFELHLDDDVDMVALESFWTFISGGSPILSAFEWMIMLHHLDALGRDETTQLDAFAVCEENTLTDSAFGIQITEEKLEPLDDGSSSAVSKADFNVIAVFKDDVVDRLEHADIDPCDACAVIAVEYHPRNDHASATIFSGLPDAHGTSHDTGAFNQSSTQSDNMCAEYSVAVDYGNGGLNTVLNMVRPESLDSHSGAAFVDSLHCLSENENRQEVSATSTAKQLEDHFIFEHDLGRANADIRQVNNGISLAMEQHLDPDLCTFGGGSGGTESVAADTMATSESLHTLQTGHVELSDPSFDSSATHSFDAQSHVNPITLCTLAQVNQYATKKNHLSNCE